MALKEKYDTQDEDNVKVDIPLFATAQEAVKNIKVDHSEIKINIVPEESSKK